MCYVLDAVSTLVSLMSEHAPKKPLHIHIHTHNQKKPTKNKQKKNPSHTAFYGVYTKFHTEIKWSKPHDLVLSFVQTIRTSLYKHYLYIFLPILLWKVIAFEHRSENS